MCPQPASTEHGPEQPSDTNPLNSAAFNSKRAQEPNVFALLKHPPIVSIDGGAGSGKSSVAKLVAEAIGGAPVLDSGRWFRALGYIAIASNIDPEDAQQIAELGGRFAFSNAPKDSPDEIIARDLSAHEPVVRGISTADLETQDVADAASKIGKHRALRAIFQARQLEEAREGCITVGRAQGSEIFSQEFSETTGQPVLRILLYANLETRATRRFLQHNDCEPTQEELTHMLRDLKTRDHRDMNRDIAPLLSSEQAQQQGYIVIDTSAISSAEVARQIVSHLRKIVPNLSTDSSI